MNSWGSLVPRNIAPRPFYVIGHNTNTAEEVRVALSLGANALEIDVTAYESRPTELCVAHRGLTGDSTGNDDDPPLVEFLQFLRKQADALPDQFALLLFDTKSPAAKPGLGKVLLEAIRKHLIDQANPLNIIISVAWLSNKGLFDEIAPMLRPREGLMMRRGGRPRRR